MRLAETVPCRNYRPRKRKEVPLDEQDKIAQAYLKDKLPQSEIARQHRVKPQLVLDLVAAAKRNPEKMMKAKEMLELKAKKDVAIKVVVVARQERGSPIVNAQSIVDQVKE